MSLFNPTMLLERLETVGEQHLCPNRIWQACSRINDWPSKQSTLQEILGGMFSKDALRHEDHSACSIDYCEFSSRNFTAVQQYHEPRSYEESDEAHENHKQKGACFPLRNFFNETKLIQAIHSDKLTAWSLDGEAILEHPRPFMAVSHVWSDGTGAGTWLSTQVNECLYGYFKRIAKRFQCDGIWWDTLCVPQDRKARSKALGIMHRNYEDARVTLVHDRFLRNVPFEGPDRACLAIVLSSWFTRGWTALELAKSRKVKIIFKDSIKDLDKHILDKACKENYATKAIKDLRRDQFSDIEDLLSTLGPRYTSWLKDRATIAGLLAGIHIPDTNKDTFQRDIYQNILKEAKEISYDHLFHNSVTMLRGFSWCATSLFHLPHSITSQKLTINDLGEVSGTWKLLSVDHFDKAKCLWGSSHELIEAKLQYVLEKESNQHLLLVKPSERGPSDIEETKKGILAKILKNPCQGVPRFKCQFVGSLYFSSPLSDNEFVMREMTIGDTEGWQELKASEDAWHIMKNENDSLLENKNERIQERRVSQKANPGAEPESEIHRAAWFGDMSVAQLQKDDRRALLEQRDKLGRQAIHLAAERGHEVFVKTLLDWNDDPNSPIYSNSPENGQTPLHRAAWGGSLETVELLLRRGSNANAKDSTGNTALHIAADMGFEEVAKRLCEQTLVETRGRNGLTPLHYAALSGHYDVAELLIAQDAVIDAKDSKIGWTPLHCAAENGQASVIELLLDKGANVSEADDKVGWAPLHFAAMSGQMVAVEKLMEKADVNKEDKNGFTPLTFAAINGHINIVEMLISHGATVNNDEFDWSLEDLKTRKALIKWLKTNSKKFREKISSASWGRLYLAAMDGHTKTTRLVVDDELGVSEESVGNSDRLLHWAAGDGRLETVRLLIQIGTDKGVEDNDGRTPLWCAATAGYDDVVQALFEDGNAKSDNLLLAQAVGNGHEVAVRALIKAGANTEVVANDRGDTPLLLAVSGGYYGIVRILLEAGADVEATNDHGDTPLLLAADTEHQSIVQILLETGANIEAMNNNRQTPLLLTAKSKHKNEGIVQILVEAGANTEAKDDLGDTPLLLASKRHQSEDIIRILLKAGANIEASSTSEQTPLLVATRYGNEGAVRALLEEGSNIEVMLYGTEETPLLLAAGSEGKSEGIVKMLLEAGANTEASDNNSRTPLSVAARYGQREIVQMLLKAGANIENISYGGETPLFLAARFGHEGAIRELIEQGANMEVKNFSGNTPLSIATRYGHEGVTQALIEGGVNLEATTKGGDTPLLIAVMWDRKGVIRALVKAGANMEAANNLGKTPLSWNRKRGQRGTFQVLKEAIEETR